MKKFTIIFCLLAFVLGTQAQQRWKEGIVKESNYTFDLQPSENELARIHSDIRAHKVDRSLAKAAVACPTDTTLLPLLKANPSGLGIEGLATATNFFSAAYQRYPVPDGASVTVSGFDLYGFVSFDSTNGIIAIPVNCNIYAAGADGAPAGSPLASVMVTMDTSGTNRADGLISLADTYYSARFSTPVTLAGDYFLEVRNPSTSTVIGLFRNSIDVSSMTAGNSRPGGGRGENDGWYDLVTSQGATGPGPGTSFSGANQAGDDLTWDCDNLLHPYVDFSIDPGFELTDGECLPHGEVSIFSNTSSGVTGTRHYNVFAAEAAYFGDVDSSWFWVADTADANSASGFVGKDFITSYSAPTSEAVVALQAFELGYGRFCTDIAFNTYPSGPLADADFSIDAIDQSTLTVSFTNNSTGTVFEWDFGDGNTSTDVLPTHQYASSGVYTISLVATHPSGACADTSSIEIGVFPTSIQDDLLNSQVKVYPNPSSGSFLVDINMDKMEEVRIEVRNMIGQTVFEQNAGGMQSGELKMNLETQQSGIYLMTLWAGERQITRKLSVNK
ncbi:MAG: PKD domain-containing protein [Bacteroidota bacterium]